MTSSPRTLRSRPATCVALTIVAASTAACELPSQGAKFANQYVSMQPTGSPPILTGYQFELGKKVSADACAEPNTHYQVALVGVNGSPSLGELAAAREAMTMLGDADMLLVGQKLTRCIHGFRLRNPLATAFPTCCLSQGLSRWSCFHSLKTPMGKAELDVNVITWSCSCS